MGERMGELGSLVEAWRDRRVAYGPRPTNAWIAERVGAKSRSSVKPWLTGESMPTAQNLRALAAMLGVNYRIVLDAALLDAGYLTEMEHRGNPAATTPAGSAPAHPRVSESQETSRRTPPPGSTQPSTDETPRQARRE